MNTIERFFHWLLGPPRLNPDIASWRRARQDMKTLKVTRPWDNGCKRWVRA